MNRKQRNPKRSTRSLASRLVAMALAFTMVFTSSGITSLAEEVGETNTEAAAEAAAAQQEAAEQAAAEQEAAEAAAAEQAAAEQAAAEQEAAEQAAAEQAAAEAAAAEAAAAEQAAEQALAGIGSGDAEVVQPEEIIEEAAEENAEEPGQETAETEAEPPVLHVVTFEAEEGATVKVKDEDVTNSTAMAEDGTIVFTVTAEEGYEITSVLVDGSVEARKNEETEEENDDYIIEGIQTDETIVSIYTQQSETEEWNGLFDPEHPERGGILTAEISGLAGTVLAKIPEGAFDKAVTLSAAAATYLPEEMDQDMLSAVLAAAGKDAEDLLYDLYVIDISFIDDEGQETEPALPVDISVDTSKAPVEMNAEEEDTEAAGGTIYHYDEAAGTASAVGDSVSLNEDEALTGMAFTSDTFSPFVLLVESEVQTLADGSDELLVFKYYEDVKTTATAWLPNGTYQLGYQTEGGSSAHWASSAAVDLDNHYEFDVTYAGDNIICQNRSDIIYINVDEEEGGAYYSIVWVGNTMDDYYFGVFDGDLAYGTWSTDPSNILYWFDTITTETTEVSLEGAEFILSKVEDGVTYYAQFSEENGSYTLTGWTEHKSEATTIVSDETGYIRINGLEDGEYILTETEAPDGYELITDPIYITVSGDATEIEVKNEPSDGSYQYGEDKVNLTFSKTWVDDNNNADETRPDSITVDLLDSEGTQVDSITVTEADGWSGTFHVAETADEAGRYNYTISEEKVSGYTSESGSWTRTSENNYTITLTNTYTGEEKEPHLTVTKTATSTPENGSTYALGEQINYTITVTNDGNVTLTDIVVTDDLTGLEEKIASLAPGESETFETSYTVTEEDIEEGHVLNKAYATGTDPDEEEPDEPWEGTDDEPTDTPYPSLYVEKTADVGADYVAASGDEITYTIKVINNGNETLTNITVTDEKTGLNETITSLAPGESREFETVYTVTEEDILAGSIKNIAGVEAKNPNGGDDVENEGSVDIPTEEKNGHITVTKETISEPENGESYALGEEITYKITVTNDGNLTITDITVTDEMTGDEWEIESLAPNASESYEASHTVDEDDILAGSVVNEATVEGTSPDPDEPEVPSDPGTDEEKTEDQNDHLTVTKEANGKPANGEYYVLGEEIDYTITVTNDGNMTLTDVKVTDTLTGLDETIESLAPGESKTFETSYTVTEADIEKGEVENTADATGKDPKNEEPDEPWEGTDDEPTENPNPSLYVEKTADVDEEYEAAPGDEITYTIKVTNNGNETLMNITVTDEMTGDEWTIDELKPGDIWTQTATYTVTEEDILAGTIENIAAVKADNPNGGDDVENEGSVDIPTEEKNGHITVTKETTSEPANGTAYAIGEDITYKITVINDGNLTITDITVTDELTGLEEMIASLAPGASVEYETSYTVTEADILNGSVVNEADVKGTSPDPDTPEVPSDPGTDEEKTEDQNDHLTVTKEATSKPANGEYYVLGEEIDYTITVTNDGNMTLTDITVTDELTGLEKTIDSLAPGQSASFDTSYIVTEEDIENGDVLNTADATGKDPKNETPDEPWEGTDDEPTETQHPSLYVEKTADVEEDYVAKLGDTISYEIYVLNNGNETLTEITVTDEMTGDEWTINSLAPGESETYTATYEVTEEDILAGSVKNVAGVEANNPKDPEDPVDNEGDVEIPTEEKNGHITVTKETTSKPENGTAYALGENITYKITVTNDGNLTITDITVTDEMTGDEWEIASLAPNASETFEASHTVDEDDILAGSVVNEATVEGTSPDPDEPEVPSDPGTDEEKTEAQNDHLTVTKKATSKPANGEYYVLGEKIDYTITVTNDGNVTLTDIEVTDKLTGLYETIDSLAPGKSATFNTSYTVTEEDIENGEVLNAADATGKDPKDEEPDEPWEGTDDEPTETPNPSLYVEKTAKVDEGYIAQLGDTITYEIYVLNNGNETLTNITVTDDLTGLAETIESLAPGESKIYTVTYVVTEKDILEGSVKNIAGVEADNPNYDPDDPDNPGDPDVKGGDEIDIPTEEKDGHITITKETTSDPENGKAYVLGEDITYKITVTNDGNLTISDITVTDEITEDAWTIDSLAPGESKEFEAFYTVKEEDILNGSVVNEATVEGTSPDPDEPEVPSDPGTDEEKTEGQNDHLTVTKEATSKPANGEYYVLGEKIDYTITVTNDGNVTLTNVVVTDELTGLYETIGSLVPGESKEFETSYEVTEEDIENGYVENTADATGKDPKDKEPDEPWEGTDDEPTETPNPSLYVEKTANVEEGYVAKLNDTITYEIYVLNNGNETLTNITVTDEMTGDEWTIEELAPGANVTYTATYVVTEKDILAGSIKNIAEVEVDNPNYDPDDPDDPGDPDVKGGDEIDIPTEEKDGHITVMKETTSRPENGEAYVLGEDITYKITVTNDGNLTITDITVTDEMTGDEWTIESLAPNASETFEAFHTVNEDDIIAGSVLNEATVEGTSPDPDEPEVPSDPGKDEEKTEDKNDHLTITKVSNSKPANGEYYVLGEKIDYTITVTNDGNVTLTNIEVTDELTGLYETIESLAPGESATFDTSYAVQEEDIKKGEVLNTAYATGTDPQDETPEDPWEGTDEEPTETPNPSMFVRKTADVAEDYKAALNDEITYTIEVINNGNETLTNVTVTDEMTGDEWTIESLAPGESWTETATYTVTEDDILAGNIANVAVAEAENPNYDPDDPDDPGEPNVDDEGKSDIPTEDADGHLTVTKEATSEPANGVAYGLGEEITYEITVTNDGNLTITDIPVKDELTGLEETIESLAPGESETFETSYTVTAEDMKNGSVVNEATASGTSPDPEKPDVPSEPGEETVPTAQFFPLDEEIVPNNDDEENPESWVDRESVNEYDAIEIEMSTTIPNVSGEVLAAGDFNMTFHNILDTELVLDELDGDFTVDINGTPIDHQYYEIDLIQTTGLFRFFNITDGCTFHVNVDLTALYNDGIINDEDLGTATVRVFFYADLETTDVNGSYKSTAWYDLYDGEEELYISDESVIAVYTFEIILDKYNTETNEAVPGATFGLYYDDNDEPVSRNEEPYTEVSDENGQVIFVGIAEGKYYVKELEAPDGYVLNDEEHIILLEGTEDGNHIYETTVGNTPIKLGPTVTKEATGTPANGTAYVEGETISYTITVRNDTDQTISDIVVKDDLTGDEWTLEDPLEPGDEKVFEVEYIVTAEDVEAGSVVNVATASGVNEDGTDSDGTGTEEVPTGTDVETEPETTSKVNPTVIKRAISEPANGSAYVEGETVTYEITVRNETDLTISDIVVKDELTGDEWLIDILKPGTEEILTTEYKVTAEDVEAGTVVNVATAEGVNEEGTSVAGDDSSRVRTGTDESTKETEETESKGTTGTTGTTGSSGSSGSSGDSGTTSTVKTADDTPVNAYMFLMIMALCALIGAGVYRRRRGSAEK